MSCSKSFAGHLELTVFIKTCLRYLDVTVTPLMLNTRTGVPTTIVPTREYSELTYLTMLWSPHTKWVLLILWVLFLDLGDIPSQWIWRKAVVPTATGKRRFFGPFLDILRHVNKMFTCFSFVVIDRCDFDTVIWLNAVKVSSTKQRPIK